MKRLLIVFLMVALHGRAWSDPVKVGSGTIVPPNATAPNAIQPMWQDETGQNFTQGFSATPWGQLRVTEDPGQLLLDTFNTATIDANQWVQTTSGGSITGAVGNVTLSSGTTLNQYAKLASLPNFNSQEPGVLMFAGRINIESPVLTTGFRAWGFFTTPGSPTIAAPLTDAVDFEIRTDGKLYAATYASGTRNFSADLSCSTGTCAQPADSKAHKYYIFSRPDITYYCIDSINNVVAKWVTGASGPDNNSLPEAHLAISNGSTAVTIVENGTSVASTIRPSVSDSVYGFRQQTIYPSAGAYTGLVSTEGQRATYRYAVLAFTPVATPTAYVVIQGSATRIIRIKRLEIGGTATAAGNMPVIVNRRSTAGTLGSAVLTAVTAGKHDTNDAAATAVVSTVGTANYTTLGTAAGGTLIADRITLPAAGTGPADTFMRDFATRNDKPIVLRGVTDFLTIEGNGAAVPAGGVLDIEIEDEEDAF